MGFYLLFITLFTCAFGTLASEESSHTIESITISPTSFDLKSHHGVTLDDGTTFEIPQQFRKTLSNDAGSILLTQSMPVRNWQAGEGILIRTSNDPHYPFVLQNLASHAPTYLYARQVDTSFFAHSSPPFHFNEGSTHAAALIAGMGLLHLLYRRGL